MRRLQEVEEFRQHLAAWIPSRLLFYVPRVEAANKKSVSARAYMLKLTVRGGGITGGRYTGVV